MVFWLQYYRIFIAAFISWELSAVTTMYNGTLYLSLNKRWCLFLTNLSLIVKVGSMSHFPLNMPLHILSWLPLHRMPTRPPSTLLASLVYNPSDILYLPLQESSMTCRPGIILIWHQLHWHQCLNTYRMLSITFLNGTAGCPMVLFDFSIGSIDFIISSHNAGISLTVERYLWLSQDTIMNKKI